MNAEVEMTRHKAFFRLKEEKRCELWDLCIDESINADSYDKLKELLFSAMNEAFRVGGKGE